MFTFAFIAPAAWADDHADEAVPESKQSDRRSHWEKDPSEWKVAIYPIYGWLPVFGASVNLPDFPNLPNLPGGGISGPAGGKVSGSFNGAAFAGVDLEKNRFTATATLLYAGLSGDSTNPKAHLGLDVIFGQAMGGYKVSKSVSLEGGFRRMALKISTSVGTRPEVSRKPGIWDPLVGITWKHQIGRKWMLRTHFDGGGFGVGSDVSAGASASADYRFAKHFGVMMGFSALHFQVADTRFDETRIARTLKIKQTMYGPLFGFGIYW
jgi:hypothetical protein